MLRYHTVVKMKLRCSWNNPEIRNNGNIINYENKSKIYNIMIRLGTADGNVRWPTTRVQNYVNIVCYYYWTYDLHNYYNNFIGVYSRLAVFGSFDELHIIALFVILISLPWLYFFRPFEVTRMNGFRFPKRKLNRRFQYYTAGLFFPPPPLSPPPPPPTPPYPFLFDAAGVSNLRSDRRLRATVIYRRDSFTIRCALPPHRRRRSGGRPYDDDDNNNNNNNNKRFGRKLKSLLVNCLPTGRSCVWFTNNDEYYVGTSWYIPYLDIYYRVCNIYCIYRIHVLRIFRRWIFIIGWGGWGQGSSNHAFLCIIDYNVYLTRVSIINHTIYH